MNTLTTENDQDGVIHFTTCMSRTYTDRHLPKVHRESRIFLLGTAARVHGHAHHTAAHVTRKQPRGFVFHASVSSVKRQSQLSSNWSLLDADTLMEMSEIDSHTGRSMASLHGVLPSQRRAQNDTKKEREKYE